MRTKDLNFQNAEFILYPFRHSTRRTQRHFSLGGFAMTKSKDVKKEAKKKAAKTLKEKREAKKAKREAKLA